MSGSGRLLYFWPVMKVAAGKATITVVVVLALLAATRFLARRPYHNWDMFPYMALAMQRPDVAFESTHRQVYAQAQANMPVADFEAISARQPDLKQSASEFELILPYYKVKPGYNFLVLAFFKMGLHPLTATWLPSILSYFAIGLMLFFWCLQQGRPLPAALFTVVIMFSPVMANLARYSSPDMLCTAFSLAGLILMLGTRQSFGLLLLTIAVTIRPDAAILTIPIVIVMWVSGKISFIYGFTWFCIQLVIVCILLSKPGLGAAYIVLTQDISSWAGLFLKALGTLLNTLTIPMAGIAALLIFLRRRQRHPDLLSLLLWAAILSLGARFILHPYMEDRFNLPAYLVILVVAWMDLSARLFPGRAVARAQV